MASALAKIVNDDTAFSIAATDAVKAEGDAGNTPFMFTVTRSGNIAGTHSIGWLVSGAQANSVGPPDFVGGASPSGALLFAPGEASKTITVEMLGDAYVEPDEHFVVLLRGASAGAAISVNNAAATVLNDDGLAPPEIAGSLAQAARADFTGDGTADVLRQASGGDLYLLDGASGAQQAVSRSACGLDFVAAIDLNGDGRADILLRDNGGALYDWTMKGAEVQAVDLLTGAKATQDMAGGAAFNRDGSAAGVAAAWMLLQPGQARTAAPSTRPGHPRKGSEVPRRLACRRILASARPALCVAARWAYPGRA